MTDLDKAYKNLVKRAKALIATASGPANYEVEDAERIIDGQSFKQLKEAVAVCNVRQRDQTERTDESEARLDATLERLAEKMSDLIIGAIVSHDRTP